MYRNLVGVFAVVLVALVLVGITFSATADTPADFIFVNGTEPKSLDPHIMTGQPEGRIADSIFEGLMYRDPKTLRPVPGLLIATEWPEFLTVDLDAVAAAMKGYRVVDARNLLDPAAVRSAGLDYWGLGRPGA